MDETKIIEAIKVFGTPVWEAARVKIYVTVGFLGISTAALIVLMIWGVRLWHKEVQKDFISKDKPIHNDAWFILIILVSLGFALIFCLVYEAILRGYATDLYVYKELLP
jgi:hypothetical protein